MAMSRLGVMGLALTTSLAGSLAVSGAALADGPGYSIKDTPVAAPFSWTGFYVGGNVGADFVNGGRMTATPNDAATQAFIGPAITAGSIVTNTGTGGGTGALGGLQAGYNWQFSNFVFGIETDIQGTTATASRDIATNVTGFTPTMNSYATSIGWLGTTRARFGVLVSPMTLAYVTGGVAYGSVERSAGANAAAFASTGRQGTIDTGWAAGAGVEWALTNKMTFGLEYLYVELDSNKAFLTNNQTGTCATGGARTCTFSISSSNSTLENQIARAKLNFRF